MRDPRSDDDRPRYPKAPLDRRVWAFLCDFGLVWLVSIVGGPLQFFVFFCVWMGVRVIIADRNRGQSPGQWAFDLRVIDPRFRRLPDLVMLAKREAILGGLATLAMVGLNINIQNGISMLLLIAPLLIDGGIAIADEEYNQAFHDRYADTLMIASQRGYSLDLRIKRLLADLQRNMRR